jgi:hypothetical protein
LRLAIGDRWSCQHVPIFGQLDAREPQSEMGFHHARLIADAASLDRCSFAIGTNALDWRQGLKHDTAPVMELFGDGIILPLRNGLGESVHVEPEFTFPLLKGTDLRNSRIDRPRRSVIVTQRRLGEQTLILRERAPRLWNYLQRHKRRFDDRKSSIYRNQPPFALFGVGPYSFAPYKVAISGLHRPPRFQAIGPIDDRPVMLNDTCYFHPCHSADDASVLTALLNHPVTLEVISALSFPDAKRPVTKRLLQQVDLSAILDQVNDAELLSRARAVRAEHLGVTDDRAAEPEAALERLKHKLRVINPD